jgi:hypothetical protein
VVVVSGVDEVDVAPGPEVPALEVPAPDGPPASPPGVVVVAPVAPFRPAARAATVASGVFAGSAVAVPVLLLALAGGVTPGGKPAAGRSGKRTST